MQIVNVPYGSSGYFSGLIKEFKSKSKRLMPMHRGYADLNSVLSFAESRQSLLPRSTLCEAISKTMSGFPLSPAAEVNINLLRSEQTYTVTCGHQLNLLGGPIYVDLKIHSVLALCRDLNLKQQGMQFVPIFWLASEDHDLDEIRSFDFFGSRFTWETEQSGPCGRMSTDGVSDLVMKAFQGTTHLPSNLERREKILAAYAEPTLARATMRLLSERYAKEGLLVLDGDQPSLKREFSHLMVHDLKAGVSYDNASQSSEMICQLGYKPQAKISEINYFTFQKGYRLKPVLSATQGTDELIKMAMNSPELLSPNVITRPVYQEFCLPNVAFVGGPGEIAYWLQLKGVFDGLKVPFPFVALRDSMLVVGVKEQRVLNKSGLEIQRLFEPIEKLVEGLIAKEEIQEFAKAEADIRKAYSALIEDIETIDSTLKGSAAAELSGALKGLESLKAKVRKAQKAKHQTAIERIQKLRAIFFPGGQPWERVITYTEAELVFGESLKSLLGSAANPLDPDVKVILISDSIGVQGSSEAESPR